MCRENSKTIKCLLLVLVVFASCKKDKPNPGVNNPPVSGTAKNVYIVCEGSFGNGNSALGLYRPTVDSIYEDIYHSSNSQQLGDVFQSMTRIGDRLFLCINNSDKIIVLNKDNWRELGVISVPKPRYVVFVSSTKAYVSSLYTNKLTVINPATMEVTDSVTMPGNNPEGMLFFKDKLYVTLWDTAVNKLYSVDPLTDHVSSVQTISGYAPKEIVSDREGKLWVLAGNIQKGRIATLTRIDPDNAQVLQSYTFPATADPLRLVTNLTGNILYFIEVNYTGGSIYNGVYRMGVNDVSLPTTAFIQAQSLQYFWGLGIRPETGDIYVGDPKGFTQKGTVYIYNENADLQTSFDCSMGPGHFYFDK